MTEASGLDTPYYGGSPTDRRMARSSAISPDAHYSLSRRVDDLRDRVGLVERLTDDISRAHSDMHSHVMGVMAQNSKRIDTIADWCKARDMAAYKQEWIISGLILTNIVVATCVVIGILTR